MVNWGLACVYVVTVFTSGMTLNDRKIRWFINLEQALRYKKQEENDGRTVKAKGVKVCAVLQGDALRRMSWRGQVLEKLSLERKAQPCVIVICEDKVHWFRLQGNGKLKKLESSVRSVGNMELNNETINTVRCNSDGIVYVGEMELSNIKTFNDGIPGQTVSSKDVYKLILEQCRCRRVGASKIQKLYRGHLVKMQYGRKERENFINLRKSVCIIQAYFRGFKTRVILSEEHALKSRAARTIQRFYREEVKVWE